MTIPAIGTTLATMVASNKARTSGSAANFADSVQAASQQYDFTSIRPIDVPCVAEDLKNSGKLSSFEAGFRIITADDAHFNEMVRGTHDRNLELQPVNYIEAFDAAAKFEMANPATDKEHSTVRWLTELRDKLAYLQDHGRLNESA